MLLRVTASVALAITEVASPILSDTAKQLYKLVLRKYKLLALLGFRIAKR